MSESGYLIEIMPVALRLALYLPYLDGRRQEQVNYYLYCMNRLVKEGKAQYDLSLKTMESAMTYVRSPMELFVAKVARYLKETRGIDAPHKDVKKWIERGLWSENVSYLDRHDIWRTENFKDLWQTPQGKEARLHVSVEHCHPFKRINPTFNHSELNPAVKPKVLLFVWVRGKDGSDPVFELASLSNGTFPEFRLNDTTSSDRNIDSNIDSKNDSSNEGSSPASEGSKPMSLSD